jgi:hypothetical protein
MNKMKLICCIFLLLCLFAPLSTVNAQKDSASTGQDTIANSKQFNAMKMQKFLKHIKKQKKDGQENTEIKLNQKFFWNLLINITTVLLIILLIYYPATRQLESVFTFFMFNLLIFMLTFVLNKITLSIGAAFGLFAVFSMLRYRTEGISLKDMTYLFIFIAVGLIGAIQLKHYQLCIIDGIIFGFTFILDGNIFFKHEISKLVEYENIELIKPDNSSLMLDDLKKRTGLNIHRYRIEKINFLRDTADIIIYYYEKKGSK